MPQGETIWVFPLESDNCSPRVQLQVTFFRCNWGQLPGGNWSDRAQALLIMKARFPDPPGNPLKSFRSWPLSMPRSSPSWWFLRSCLWQLVFLQSMQVTAWHRLTVTAFPARVNFLDCRLDQSLRESVFQNRRSRWLTTFHSSRHKYRD